MLRKKEKVLGFNIDLLTFDEAVKTVLDAMKNKQGMQIITINPEMIETARKNNSFSNIINNAELVIPDSSGIEIALKLKGIKQSRIPGIDLAKELLKKCAALNYPVALIGAKEDVIQSAKEKLKAEMENLNICFSRNGYFTTDEEEEIIKDAVAAKPIFVLVALGAPKQEIFINKCREKLPDAIYIGVGGSFDVWAGVVSRAPEIFKKLRCEWLYRTIKQPNRIKRIYKTLPMFLFKVIIETVREKF